MDTPTLSVKSYRGVSIYIRRLFRETFEYLIAMDGQIFCNQVEIRREVGQRMAKYSDEDIESAVAFMLDVAQQFVDDRLFAQAQERTWLYRFDRFKEKVAAKVFHLWYLLTEGADKIKTYYERKFIGKKGH